MQPYADAGTPVVNKMVQATVVGDVSGVRVADRVGVRYDGEKHWWVVDGDRRVGRTPWSISLFDQKPWQTLPVSGPVEPQHLLARRDHSRALAMLEPLMDEIVGGAPEVLDRTLDDLLGDDEVARLLRARLPGVGQVEMVNASANMTLRDLLSVGSLPVAVLNELTELALRVSDGAGVGE